MNFWENIQDAAKNVSNMFTEAGNSFAGGNVWSGIKQAGLGTLSAVGNVITFGGANAVGSSSTVRSAVESFAKRLGIDQDELEVSSSETVEPFVKSRAAEAVEKVRAGYIGANLGINASEPTFSSGAKSEPVLSSGMTVDEISERTKQSLIRAYSRSAAKLSKAITDKDWDLSDDFDSIAAKNPDSLIKIRENIAARTADAEALPDRLARYYDVVSFNAAFAENMSKFGSNYPETGYIYDTDTKLDENYIENTKYLKKSIEEFAGSLGIDLERDYTSTGGSKIPAADSYDWSKPLSEAEFKDVFDKFRNYYNSEKTFETVQKLAQDSVNSMIDVSSVLYADGRIDKTCFADRLNSVARFDLNQTLYVVNNKLIEFDAGDKIVVPSELSDDRQMRQSDAPALSPDSGQIHNLNFGKLKNAFAASNSSFKSETDRQAMADAVAPSDTSEESVQYNYAE